MVVSVNADRASLFVRTAAALALTDGQSIQSAARYATERWPDTPAVGMYLERAASSATLTSADGAALAAPGTADFLALVNPRTVLGRLQRLRRVPFSRTAAVSTGGAVFAWVGEGAPTPVGHLAFSPASLPVLKVGGIVVGSDELFRMSAPSGERLFRDEMVSGLAKFTDTSFLSANAAVAGVSPAGITNGATSTATAGDAETDLAVLLDAFDSLDGVVVVASEKTAIALAGQGSFRNGLLYGVVPVILSSAADDRLIAIQAPKILFADEGEVGLSSASHATLQMDTAPTNPPVAATVMVSLWEANLIAVKIIRFMNWSALSGSVSVITGVAY